MADSSSARLTTRFLARERMFYNRPTRSVSGRGSILVEPRPANAGHGHAVLVFDGRGRLDLPLTTFARETARRLSQSSVTVYLYALLPFFGFLAGSGPSPERPWDSDFAIVRNRVGEYLEDRAGCVVRHHRLGFELVQVAGRTRTNVGAFLAAFKLFYAVMCEVGCYSAENPLIEVTSRVRDDFEDDDLAGGRRDPPKMPLISGVVPPPRSHPRLTDSFFKLVGEAWVPQIVDDASFPVSVMNRKEPLAPLWRREPPALLRTFASRDSA